jgi:cytochrome c553
MKHIIKTNKVWLSMAALALLVGCSNDQAPSNEATTSNPSEQVNEKAKALTTAIKSDKLEWDGNQLTATLAVMPQGDIQRGEKAHNKLTCISCHAVQGQPNSRNFVNLNGQPENYLKKVLIDYRDDRRAESYGQSKIMNYISKDLSNQDIADLAVFYSSQGLPKGKDASFHTDDGIVKLVREGDMAAGLMGCAACHGANGEGNGDLFPALAGQEADYTIRTLKAYRSGDRNNDVNGMMQSFARNLSDAEIEGLAAYYENINP